MKLYNTLSRKLEEFKSLEPSQVKFYHCGPTVYWVQHIGNMRAVVWSDLIRRSLEFLDYKVTFVRNYTDVGHLTSDEDQGEDKMEKGAKREGLSPDEIANKYIKIFDEDIKKLNILRPDFRPRATEYIEPMIEMIKTLLDKKHAYITDLAIYFDVSTFKNYNKLNKQKMDLNEAGKGKGNVEDHEKRHFSDFALWFFKKGSHKNALQTWPSLWGEGFPGWHIECSVMAKKLLGDTIDIHMGGVEHIPVHHTNEIAQSEAANGVKFVNYWLHNEHLNVDGAKMAKSQGTGFTLAQIIEKGFDPHDLRYFFLNAHYRSKQNFTWEALKAAQTSYTKMKNMVNSYKIPLNSPNSQRTALSDEKLTKLDQYRTRFVEAISNDFQIPQALAIMWEMLKSNVPSQDKGDLALEFDQILGLNLSNISKPSNESVPPEILQLAQDREDARKNKDFKLSDDLRQKITEKGFTIEDSPSGFKIKKLLQS